MAIKTIVVKDYSGVRGEAIANAAITPGHLIYLLSTNKVAVHAVAGGVAERMFALEDELQGKEIGDAYAAAALCQFGIFRSGDEVYAILANGENASIGSYLDSNGNGELKVHTPLKGDSSATTDDVNPIAVALEALDMSDSSAADPSSARIRVRIL